MFLLKLPELYRCQNLLYEQRRQADVVELLLLAECTAERGSIRSDIIVLSNDVTSASVELIKHAIDVAIGSVTRSVEKFSRARDHIVPSNDSSMAMYMLLRQIVVTSR